MIDKKQWYTMDDLHDILNKTFDNYGIVSDGKNKRMYVFDKTTMKSLAVLYYYSMKYDDKCWYLIDVVEK